MTLADEVRAHAARVVENARWVRIDLDAAGAIEPGGTAELDPERHYLDGPPEHVAAYLVCLSTINFGSGWFPTINKRAGMSGYFTVASSLADRFRASGPWSNEQLRALTTDEVADVLGQRRDHELMTLFSQALRQLGTFLGDRTPLELARSTNGSADALARTVAAGMSMWNDVGFYKRAQILGSDLQLGGVATFRDVDDQTIYADNLVPHVLRCDGVLVYDQALADVIDSEQVLTSTEQEREIRAAAVHVCAHIARRMGVTERILDLWLWNRGQAPEYKARPRHRARTVFY
jgi:Potential Queuosine, Q, salvage protein family